ncbi:malonyl-[acyl-carrier protein] O-methyltransferase BioC [Labilibaculum filiforme]|uniref:Malonyl-[acyl-carrier protein] O-methyltransferase n=1 Tax=Labilibaculum filiforme TaxID=1940526 RepID=A0A2N3HQJ5_9BACT|nr:malonyl-ACP O-methyltransferase BioC [Labilibaculum filiforme]PKQ60334.1 malonyl-[acyl-carrier protein] O-methyltransferase BioC [Labilibaculum filiforme]
MKHQNINKDKVQKGFVKSIETYRKHAIVQEAIASRLINELLRQPKKHFPRVLEIGCGPAVLTEKFFQKFNADLYYANDIVKEYANILKSIHSDIQFLGGDIEAMELPQNMNLIISSSTFQWFNNLDEFLTKIHKALQVDGLLVFSTFGPDNFREIREVNGKGLNYLSFGKLERLLSEKFEILWSDKETITRFFSNPLGVLAHMKQTGVNGIPGKAWTKTDLKNFNEDYQDLFGTDLGVPLTYQPLYFIAKPKKIH